MPFIDLADIEAREPIPGYRVRFVHGDTMTTAYWDIEAGARMPVHTHEHEQICSVLAGEFELELDAERRRMGPGSVAVIPSNASHGGRAISHCRVLDVFHPVREDYR